MAEIAKQHGSEDRTPTSSPLAAGAARPAATMAKDDFGRDVWCVLGVAVDAITIDHAIGLIDAAVSERRALSLVTPNVNWLVRALRCPQARREMLNADLSLVDGAPLAAIAKWLGVPLPSRIAGADLFEALRRRPGFRGRRIKVFFFGGRDGAAEAAATAINNEGGGLEAAGWLNPGFGDVDSMSVPEVIEQINKADADFVVVALGAEKGQAWIDRNRHRLRAPVIAHLGAVVNFTGGGVARAPVILRKLGIEWIWRIFAEPALWRRYLADGLALIKIALTRLPAIMLRRGSKKTPPEPFHTSSSHETGSCLVAFSNRKTAHTFAENALGAVAVQHEYKGGVLIALSGAMIASNLGETRAAFRAAASGGGDVVVELSQVDKMDLAFLGLLLMLEKHVLDGRRRLFVNGASPRQLAVLRANDMTYEVSSVDIKKLQSSEVAA